jgi:uncharacterized protein with GYD domain
MPTYIGLIKFTDQGIKSVKETVHRREAIRKAAGAMGVKFTAYLRLGATTMSLSSTRQTTRPLRSSLSPRACKET